MEKSDADGIRLEDTAMDTLPLRVVLEWVLDSRSPEYVDTLLEKLIQEGITEPKGLQLLSREGIQTMLGSKQTFNMGEVSDIVNIRDAIGRSCCH